MCLAKPVNSLRSVSSSLPIFLLQSHREPNKMGASSSRQQISQEQKELESLAASRGALLILQNVFSKLADPQTNSIPLKSLHECFCLNFTSLISEASPVPECFQKLLFHLGPTIVDQFFMADKGGVHWIEFLRGYIRCCASMSTSISLNTLYRLYAATCSKAGIASKLEFESDDADCKINGSFTSTDVLMLLWMCWILSQSSIIWKFSKQEAKLDLPDISHLILSAITSCAEVGNDLNIWDCSISDSKVELPAQKFHMWALTTVPNLAYCISQYVHARLQRCAYSEHNSEPSDVSIGDISCKESRNTHLLTCGRAWAISLTLRSALSEELLRVCIPRNGNETFENLLYCSSLHGKGLNRFWTNVGGYLGSLLILVSASSGFTHEGDSNVGRWVVGILTEQGFENKDVFYGSSGYLYALSPIFHVLPPYGKEKNFVYSHLHPSGRVYEPHPKPVGIAFGGTTGNERISIEEDFARITVRHHAVDKTYKPGSLVPSQGFLPIEAAILEVEVWGLGGETAKEVQNRYKKRETLFTEQRRKVDLKKFSSWEDSPEKMMMDMVSDPNRIQREDR